MMTSSLPLVKWQLQYRTEAHNCQVNTSVLFNTARLFLLSSRWDLAVVLVFALVFLAVGVSFAIFRPKNACQVPKPPNSLKQNKIQLAH
jgi:hypothetical protein